MNDGVLLKYHVLDFHEAIIDRGEWEIVQGEMARRKSRGRHHNSLSLFSAKLVCGDCGDFYDSKVWHSTDKYKGAHKCTTPHLMEDEIKAAFLAALDSLLTESETLLEGCSFMYDALADVSRIAAECETLADEMETLSIRIERLITENATTAQDQGDYQQKYGRLERQFESAKRKFAALEEKKKVRFTETEEIRRFADMLKTGKAAGFEFTESL